LNCSIIELPNTGPGQWNIKIMFLYMVGQSFLEARNHQVILCLWANH